MPKIGSILRNIFSLCKTFTRYITRAPITPLNVREGSVQVFRCGNSAENSTINIIMALYASSGFYPEPTELLFCTDSTTQEQIDMFLTRCFHMETIFRESEPFEKARTKDSNVGVRGGGLFCLVNFQTLSLSQQFFLSDKITEHVKDSHRKMYKLALICGGTSSGNALDGFPTVVTSGALKNTSPRCLIFLGISDVGVTHMFAEICSQTIVITSDWAGLGKTQTIKERARAVYFNSSD